MSKELSVVVERGTKQIGGCCTIIKYGQSCIAIDIGSELPEQEQNVLYVTELMGESESRCEGLFLTHYHGDHIGEISKLNNNINIYASSATKRVMDLYQKHMGIHSPFCVDMDRITEIEYGSPVTLGEFVVTAIASDHSAIGSVMYLIEVGGKRILHTGDFRLHGNRKNQLMDSIKNIGKIDLLITEGTTLTRKADKEEWDEERVRQELEKFYDIYKYVFVLASSTNLNRLQIISEQVKQRKYFIVSSFQRKLIDLAEELGECKFNKPLSFGNNLINKMEKYGFVMLVNSNATCEELMEYYFSNHAEDSCLIYSMWSGYMEYENVKRICDIAGNKMFFAHSSGHVTVEDLNGFIDIVNPTKVIVIHTESDAKENIIRNDRIIEAKDGEKIMVD
jgi:ribonuclease J